MWHVGLLYRLGDMLTLLDEKPITPEMLLADLPIYRGVRAESLLAIALKANWVQTGDDRNLSLTTSGRALIDLAGPIDRLRVQVKTLMDILPPHWAPVVVQGRQAFAQYAPPEAVQCFREAGMLTTTETDVVAWWDSVAARYRHNQDMQRVETGREGERLSFQYELERTGKEPFWVALEFAGAGYDIRSVLASDCDDTLLIEVKTSTISWDNATFHLTCHEWEVLNCNHHSILHLWSLASDPPVLSVVPIEHLSTHIPLDQGSGCWELMQCPFGAFRKGTDLTCGEANAFKADR